MTDKRLGRQSAETARQTKQQILKTATIMFCEEGYNAVSLRGLGERAGISHSLIRHHFGCKLNIWKRVSDSIHAYFMSTIKYLIEAQKQDVPNNQHLCNLLLSLLASLLIDRRPMQLLNDVFQCQEELLEYFFGEDEIFSQQFIELVEDCHNDGYAVDIQPKQFKWILASSAYSAVQLRPLLTDMCSGSTEDALKRHWSLMAKMLGAVLSVPESKMPDVDQVFEAVLHFEFSLDDFLLVD